MSHLVNDYLPTCILQLPDKTVTHYTGDYIGRQVFNITTPLYNLLTYNC